MSIAPGVTAPALSALAAVRDLASDETREQLRDATPEERADWLIALQRISDAAAAAIVLATDVFDAKGDAEILRGAQTTQAWIRAECRTSATEADQQVRLARASRMSFHHRLVHEGGWSVTVNDQSRGTHGAIGLAGPHGRTLTSHSRGP